MLVLMLLKCGKYHRYFNVVGVEINQESQHSRSYLKEKCVLTLRRYLTPPIVNIEHLSSGIYNDKNNREQLSI